MVQLAEAGRLKAVQIADCFGVTPVYLSQLRGRYRQQGSVALRSKRRGPKGPMKVTPRLEIRVRKLREKGKTYKAIAAEVSGQQEISYQTVRRILQKDEVQQSLLKTEVTEEYLAPPSEPVDRAPVVKISKEGESQYAGAMLLHVALGEIGLWSVFEKVGALVGQTKLGVKQVVGTIALGFALQLRSIEGFKTALRGDFGMLLGLAKCSVRADVANTGSVAGGERGTGRRDAQAFRSVCGTGAGLGRRLLCRRTFLWLQWRQTTAERLRTPLIDGTYQQGIANMASSTPIALHDLA